MNALLKGIRVLDFGRYIAGPYCASLLGQMGAEVIRIERPGGSEDRFIMPVTETGDGGMYLQVNVHKKGMTLDIASTEGKRIVRHLVETADVIIANMPDKTLRVLGLDYETLKAIKSDIILTTNTAFGTKGAFANRIGFDGMAQAMSGANFFSGRPGQPVRAAVNYVDFSTALSAALGTLAALMVRERTGEGQIVETSLLATALTLSNNMLIEQALLQNDRVPTGNRSQVVGPADLFKTKDGHVVVQVVGPYIFKRWIRLIGEESWLSDPRFQDDTSRGENRDLLCQRMAEWCLERTNSEALLELEEARIPAGPVLSYQEALDHSTVRELGHLKRIEFPGTKTTPPISNTPFTLSRTKIEVNSRAPIVGEHTIEILMSLGYSQAQIAHLATIGVI